MPEPARRFTAPPYDQFEDSDHVSDWGGDDLFTRMPRPRAVDDAPPPRFARTPGTDARGSAGAPRSLVLLDPPRERRDAAAVDRRSGQGDRRRAPQSAEHGTVAPAELLGLPVVAPAGEPAYRRTEPAAPSAPASEPTYRSHELDATVPEPGHRWDETVPEPAYRWDETGALIVPEPAGRRTSVITGHPSGMPRPLPLVRAERRRAPRTPAEWIGSRPERIVGWAFALGLILILIAITTADAATV